MASPTLDHVYMTNKPPDKAVNDGERIALLGSSGRGESWTLRMIPGSFLIAFADRGVELETGSIIRLGIPVHNLLFFDADSEGTMLHGTQPAKG